jgi:hypothetical protein
MRIFGQRYSVRFSNDATHERTSLAEGRKITCPFPSMWGKLILRMNK